MMISPFQPISSATSERGMDVKADCCRQSLALALTSIERSLTFAYRLKRKLLTGPIFGEAYTVTQVDTVTKRLCDQKKRWVYIDNDKYNHNSVATVYLRFHQDGT
jgi:hypothetical protein